MTTDWKRDLVDKIVEKVWAMDTTDVLYEVIEETIKEFAEKRLVRVYFSKR